MKKNITLILTLSFFYGLYSQSHYQSVFDSKGYASSTSFSTSNNQLSYAWSGSARLESLIVMYEATSDTKYLHTAIKCMGNIIDRRDDLRDGIGLSKIYDYRGIAGPTWSTNHYNKDMDVGPSYGWLVHSANITFSMAKVAAIIKKNVLLHNITSSAGGRYGNDKFIDIASSLIARVNETLNSHSDQWVDSGNKGWYRERCGNNVPINYSCVIMPMNMLALAGRVHVNMYVAGAGVNHLVKATKLANFMKGELKYHSATGSYIWNYWSYIGMSESIAYSAETSSFFFEIYENGLSYKGVKPFTLTDMHRLAKTFSKYLYKGPLKLHTSLSNQNSYSNFTNGQKFPNWAFRWISYSKYDKNISQIILDDILASSGGAPDALLLAYCARYSSILVPFAANHSGTTAKWSGGACGNFGVNEKPSFLAVDNSTGTFFKYQVVGENIKKLTSKTYSSAYNWKGGASGNFFGSGEDEFVSMANHSNNKLNGYYVFKATGNKVVEYKKSVGWGPASDWAGVAAGNFISGGYDDIITVRNFRKQVYVYKSNGSTLSMVRMTQLSLPASAVIANVASGNFDSDTKDELVFMVNNVIDDHTGYYVYDINENGSLSLIAKSVGWGPASEWRGLAVGDVDGDGKDEFIVHRNFDGQYKIRKLCNRTICTLGVEYFPTQHSRNNVLYMGDLDETSKNDELVVLRNCDGGIVTFTTNKPVSVKKSRNNILPEGSFVMKSKAELFQQINKVGVFPNPSDGVLYINTNRPVEEEVSYKIYNSQGRWIKTGEIKLGKEEVDLTKCEAGIYMLNIVSGDISSSHKIILK